LDEISGEFSTLAEVVAEDASSSPERALRLLCLRRTRSASDFGATADSCRSTLNSSINLHKFSRWSRPAYSEWVKYSAN
jgi:hypothetical protein